MVGPSNTTLKILLGSIVNLTSHIAKDDSDRKSDKDVKKNKFTKLSEASQKTTLFTSSKKKNSQPTITTTTH